MAEALDPSSGVAQPDMRGRKLTHAVISSHTRLSERIIIPPVITSMNRAATARPELRPLVRYSRADIQESNHEHRTGNHCHR